MYDLNPNSPRVQYLKAEQDAAAAQLQADHAAAGAERDRQAAAEQAERDRENQAARQRRLDADAAQRTQAQAASQAQAHAEADARFAAQKTAGLHEWLAAHPESTEAEYLTKSWPHRRAALLAQERAAQFETTRAGMRATYGF